MFFAFSLYTAQRLPLALRPCVSFDAAHFPLSQRKNKRQGQKRKRGVTQSCRVRSACFSSLLAEAAVTEAKMTTLRLKRAGDAEGAKAALRAAKAHQAELEETRALLA